MAKRGATYRFTQDVKDSGWTFAPGDVVVLTDDYVPHLDWFQHMVLFNGQSRRIGAGVLDLYAEEIG